MAGGEGGEFGVVIKMLQINEVASFQSLFSTYQGKFMYTGI